MYDLTLENQLCGMQHKHRRLINTVKSLSRHMYHELEEWRTRGAHSRVESEREGSVVEQVAIHHASPKEVRLCMRVNTGLGHRTQAQCRRCRHRKHAADTGCVRHTKPDTGTCCPQNSALINYGHMQALPETAKSGSARSTGSRSVRACMQTSTAACGQGMPGSGASQHGRVCSERPGTQTPAPLPAITACLLPASQTQQVKLELKHAQPAQPGPAAPWQLPGAQWVPDRCSMASWAWQPPKASCMAASCMRPDTQQSSAKPSNNAYDMLSSCDNTYVASI